MKNLGIDSARSPFFEPVLRSILVGAVLLVMSGVALRSAELLYDFVGRSGGDKLGMLVIAAGDVNGDGADDFAAGVSYHDGPAGVDAGRVVLYSGSDCSVLYTVEGKQEGERFGTSLLLVDDIDNDHIAELVVGAPECDCSQNVNSGRIYLLSGATGVVIARIDGKQEGESFGFSLASAGDLSGNDVMEILVGSPNADGPAGFDCGRITIFGLDGRRLMSATGEAPGDRFGYCSAAIGPSASDETWFIAVSAPWHNSGGLMSAGRVYIFSVPSGLLLTKISGTHADDLLGKTLCSSGDYSGDGVLDLVVGIPGFDGAAGVNSGKINALNGASGKLLASLEGEASRDQFGSALCALSDINGDLCDELLVGSPYYDTSYGTNNGRVYVIDGAMAAPQYVLDASGEGDLFGTSVASIGDVSGDGKADILVGAPSHDRPLGNSDTGRIHVYSGAAADEIDRVDGDFGGDQFGYTVDGARADFNNDGRADFLIAAIGYNDANGAGIGQVCIHSAVDGALLYSVEGDEDEALFGGALAGLEDVNGDNVGDFLVGAAYHDVQGEIDCGSVFLYLGGQSTPYLTLSGGEAQEYFGWSLARVPDHDGDLKPDYLVGAPGASNARGKVYLFSGAQGTLIHTLIGENDGDRFGSGVSSAGDVNQDGLADLLIGAPRYNQGTLVDCGKAYIFSAADFSLLRVHTGADAGNRFGMSLACIGDITGDSFPEYMVGASHQSGTGGTCSGAAFVYSGATAQLLYFYEGESLRAFYGRSMAGLGDADGDGINDYCVGAYRHSVPGSGDRGCVYVYSGVDGSLADTVDGEFGGDQIGWSVAAAGDVNLDGRADFVTGASLYNSGDTGYNSGKAYVFAVSP